MVEGGIGISAVVTVGSKFTERSKFVARHDVIYDKEADKSVKLAERFDKIDKEDVDRFEFQEYTQLRAKSLNDLRDYKSAQEEYEKMEWYREPAQKYQSRTKVRKAKRKAQSSIAREAQHVDELETYSRSVSSNSPPVSCWSGSESGLDLARSLPYRTDSCSIRAAGGSPPWVSMEDICEDEKKDRVFNNVSDWLSSIEEDRERERIKERDREKVRKFMVMEMENYGDGGDESDLICVFCHISFTLSYEYALHMEWHTKIPYKCSSCEDQFISGDLLSTHFDEWHTNKYPAPNDDAPSPIHWQLSTFIAESPDHSQDPGAALDFSASPVRSLFKLPFV